MGVTIMGKGFFGILSTKQNKFNKERKQDNDNRYDQSRT